jgi:hypothetical protein
MLSRTGYVNQKTTSRYLIYMFLCDFTDTVYDYFCEEDYDLVNSRLTELMSGGGCLLPYKTLPGRHVHIGKPRSENLSFDKRITEDASGNVDRITENGYQRGAVL